MRREYLYQNKKLALMLLLGASIVCAAVILFRVTGFFADSSKAATLLKDAVAQSKPDANDMEKRLADSKTIAEELKKKNLFAPPPPKQHPVSAVSGIMGDEVLINETWYKLGQMVGDAKIVAIEPTRVKIAWDGQEKVFAPIDAPTPAGPSGPGRGPEVARAARPEQAGTGGDAVVQVQPSGPPGPGGPGMGMFGNVSEEDRARMREQFTAMRQRFENMSDGERERMRDEMRQRFGGRGGEGDRGPDRRGR